MKQWLALRITVLDDRLIEGLLRHDDRIVTCVDDRALHTLGIAGMVKCAEVEMSTVNRDE